jgi:uncharacterized hydrophobic protein (TIGR00271 family)
VEQAARIDDRLATHQAVSTRRSLNPADHGFGSVPDIRVREDGGVLHLRLIVPAESIDVVVELLASTPGVVHLVRGAGSATLPHGEVVSCDVARESANEIIERLQDHGVHRAGAIVVEAVELVVSDAAAAAEASSPGEGGDALVWEQLEARTRDEATLTVSFLVFMSIAATIAAIGILLDSPILVIGAMVVGPDYGPLAALCVALVRRRGRHAVVATRTLVGGVLCAALAAFVATLLFRVTSIAPDEYDIGDRQLTAFIARPDALGAVVAVLAGVVGMLSLTEGRSGALIGVLVSVTTIPAVGNVGAAAAYGSWADVGGAATQLGVNVAGLVVAGVVTLQVQARATTARPSRLRRRRA